MTAVPYREGTRKHALKTRKTDSRSKKFVLSAKLAHCCTGPYEISFVGPGTTSDGKKVGPNLLLLGVRKDEPGREINARVSMYRCKKSYNPHEGAEVPKFLPWAIGSYDVPRT